MTTLQDIRRTAVTTALLALCASTAAQSAYGALGDPLASRPTAISQRSAAGANTSTRVRYTVLEGQFQRLAGFNGPWREQLIQQHRQCRAAKPGSAALSDSAFPTSSMVSRQESYLSADAMLKVQFSAMALVELPTCGLRWQITWKGTLSRNNTAGVCAIDYEARTVGGRCDMPGNVALRNSQAVQQPPGTAPPPSKQLAGQTCYVLNAASFDAYQPRDATICTWLIDKSQADQYPGMLSHHLPLEIDYGHDNGVLSPVQAVASQQADPRLFDIPAGFKRIGATRR
jgi:hypothetical protein